MSNIVLEPYGKDTTLVGVQDIRGNDAVVFSNHDVVVAIMQWLREVDDTTRMNVISAMVLEHQVSAHITTKTEEERLQSQNMGRDDLIMVFVRALAEASYRDIDNPQSRVHVEIQDIYAILKDKLYTDVPPYVLYTFLKTMEYFTGRVVDIGEGFFTLVETGQKTRSLEQRAKEINAMIDQLPEEGRDLVQTHVVNSLHGTNYEI